MKHKRIRIGPITSIALSAVVLAVCLWQGNRLFPYSGVQILRMGRYPSAIAIDANSGQVLVASSSQPPQDMSPLVIWPRATATSLLIINEHRRMSRQTIHLPGPPLNPMLSDPSLIVAEQAGRAFIITQQNTGSHLSVIDLHTDRIAAFSASPNPSAVEAVPPGNRILVASSSAGSCSSGTEWAAQPCTIAQPGDVRIYNAHSGRLLHRFTVRGRAQALALDGQAARLIVGSSLTGGAGGVELISVLNTVTKRLLRCFSIGRAMGLRIAVDQKTGRSFVLTTPFPYRDAGTLRVVDNRSGVVLRTMVLKGVPNGMSVDERLGRVYVPINGPEKTTVIAQRGGGSIAVVVPTGIGHVLIIDARNGKTVFTTPVGFVPSSVAIDARRGHVFVVNRGGGWNAAAASSMPASVMMLSASGNTVLDTWPIGPTASAIAMDERAGLAFIVNTGGIMHAFAPQPEVWLLRWLRHWLPFLTSPPSTRHVVQGSLTAIKEPS